jgi:hypothetical protein
MQAFQTHLRSLSRSINRRGEAGIETLAAQGSIRAFLLPPLQCCHTWALTSGADVLRKSIIIAKVWTFEATIIKRHNVTYVIQSYGWPSAT